MSNTSLSCAMSWVLALWCSISQMVQVVSMEEVPMRDGSVSFQSNEVRGAHDSRLLFCIHVCMYI